MDAVVLLFVDYKYIPNNIYSCLTLHYLRMSKYTFSPTTTPARCRYDPRRAMSSPPKEKYAVLPPLISECH